VLPILPGGHAGYSTNCETAQQHEPYHPHGLLLGKDTRKNDDH
jgi:hypothetical protein